MAKLVDALPSGGSVRKDVLVRIQFWAQRPSAIAGVFYWGALKARFQKRTNKKPGSRDSGGGVWVRPPIGSLKIIQSRAQKKSKFIFDFFFFQNILCFKNIECNLTEQRQLLFNPRG